MRGEEVNIYVSSSTQGTNIGVGGYGAEQERMMLLSDRVKFFVMQQYPDINVLRNKRNMTLGETAADCNANNCVLFVDNHSNAGPVETVVDGKGSEGTEAFYNADTGITGESYRLASLIYKYVAPVSPGGDRGVKPDEYPEHPNGLFIIRKTNPPATLLEHIFHTNLAEVQYFIARMDEFAIAEAKGIIEFLGRQWRDLPDTKAMRVLTLVRKMIKAGLVTGEAHWYGVLMGTTTFVPSYAVVAFQRAVDKILG